MGALLPVIEKISMFTFLVSSMLAIGLTLSPAAILAPLRDARLVFGILVLNFVVAPALAYLVTVVVPISRGHAIGLILLGGAAAAEGALETADLLFHHGTFPSTSFP